MFKSLYYKLAIVLTGLFGLVGLAMKSFRRGVPFGELDLPARGRGHRSGHSGLAWRLPKKSWSAMTAR